MLAPALIVSNSARRRDDAARERGAVLLSSWVAGGAAPHPTSEDLMTVETLEQGFTRIEALANAAGLTTRIDQRTRSISRALYAIHLLQASRRMMKANPPCPAPVARTIASTADVRREAVRDAAKGTQDLLAGELFVRAGRPGADLAAAGHAQLQLSAEALTRLDEIERRAGGPVPIAPDVLYRTLPSSRSR